MYEFQTNSEVFYLLKKNKKTKDNGKLTLK
jgi:hypothetical protein